MAYRPPTHPPVTAWASHLDKEMRDRGWSRVRLFEEVGAELGYSPKSRSAFLPLLIDKQPSTREASILASHFGAPEPEPDKPQNETPDLAQALAMLATEMGEWRRERQAMRGELDALKELVGKLVGASQPGLAPEAPAVPDAPPAKAGSVQ